MIQKEPDGWTSGNDGSIVVQNEPDGFLPDVGKADGLRECVDKGTLTLVDSTATAGPVPTISATATALLVPTCTPSSPTVSHESIIRDLTLRSAARSIDTLNATPLPPLLSDEQVLHPVEETDQERADGFNRGREGKRLATDLSLSETLINIVEIPMKTVAGTDLLNVRDRALLQTTGLTDMVLLYFTLLADKAVPSGFLHEFVNLETSMRRSSEKSMKLAASLSDAEAERLLGIEKERKIQNSLNSSSAADQLMIAADIKPRRFRTKWQQASYEGPTARHDAETAERSRWIISQLIFYETRIRLWGVCFGRIRPTPSCWEAAGEQVHFGLASAS